MLPEGRLQAIYGAFGGGKSLEASRKIVAFYDQGYRRLITNLHVTADHAGFKGGKCPVEPKFAKRCPEMEVLWLDNEQLKTFWTRPEYQKGSVVVVDESHCVYDSAEWKDEKKNAKEKGTTLLAYWSQIRKYKDQVLVITQEWGGFPTFIRFRIKEAQRRFTLWFCFCSRTFFFEGGQIVSAQRFGTMTPKKFWSPYFGFYLTHARAGEVYDPEEKEAAFKPKRVPLRVAVVQLVLLVALACGGGWGVYKVLDAKCPWLLDAYCPWRHKAAAVAAAPAGAGGEVLPVVRGVVRPHAATEPAVVIPRYVPGPPPPEVSVVKGKYYANEPGKVVLGVVGDVVQLGLPAGRVRSVPRDEDSEYEAVRGQRAGFERTGHVGRGEGFGSSSGSGDAFGGSAHQGNMVSR